MTVAWFPKVLALNLPVGFPLLVLIGLLIAGFAEGRRGHIGRVAIFLNALLLWQVFYNSFNKIPNILQWYLNIGSVIGIIALGTYLVKKSLPTEFYKFSYWCYGSLSVLIAIGGAFYFKIPMF